MDFATIVSFLLLTVPAYFTPGPNNLMLMTSAAKFGMRSTLPHAMGIVVGFPFMVFALGLGLGELFAAYPQIKTWMKFAAAAYFMWMAWHLLGLKISETKGRSRPMRFIEAAGFQWINPKAWAMGTSFVAAFVVSGDGRFSSLFWLTLGCLAIAPMSSLFWMISGQQLQAFLIRTGAERYLGAILAVLMVVAVVLFLI